MDVHFNSFYKVVMLFVSIFTIGIGGLGMWLESRYWPRRIDKTGMILRNGRQVAWSGLTDTRAMTTVGVQGKRITGRLELEFGKTKVKIVPQSLKDGQLVIEYISQILGTELQTG